ncbi:MAG: BON domain-containing protein [Deltaproteobacteria bacterium]|nr:MAG: BON domain-containing protein [Deltaproteobacteria bacterium]
MAILTISREYGSGGREIGRRVAARLDYRYADKELLFQDLEKGGPRWVKAARELDEVCPTVWERYDWQYRGYVALVESLILTYAADDRVVIIGRGGSFLLEGVPFCLRARLVAPLEVRIERIMERERLSRVAAERLITRVDGDRACFIKANYGCEWNEDRFYDMTLNTGSLTYNQVEDILAEALGEKERLAAPEARAELALKALAHRLKARMATEPRLFVPTLEVSVQDGTIVVTGIIHNPKEVHLLQEIAKEVCGEQPVRFDLHHRV